MIAYAQMKLDLATHFVDNGITDTAKGLQDLCDSLTPNILKDNDLDEDSSNIVRAWTALQIGKGSPLRYHASDTLGVFIYNSNMYSIRKVRFHKKIIVPTLRYNVDYQGDLEIPEGCISTIFMFYRLELPEGFRLGDTFDTHNVVAMNDMFAGCKMPVGFSLGNNFDTSNVEYMKDMFANCKIPKGFTLGDKFDTSKVVNMVQMFRSCEFPEGFTLGNKFNTSNVTNMAFMFYHLSYKSDFTLGDNFDTSSVTDMTCMFEGIHMGYHFSLGDNFSTSKVRTMESMFENVTFCDDFTLGKKFTILHSPSVEAMFRHARIGRNFDIGDFEVEGRMNHKEMFKYIYIPKSYTRYYDATKIQDPYGLAANGFNTYDNASYAEIRNVLQKAYRDKMDEYYASMSEEEREEKMDEKLTLVFNSIKLLQG